ncbi:MAG: peptidylprolyl isomerase [Rickettsiales bacterium]|nr:peptidylprolyl isomerase [Rickettsiales bacterium]
MQKPYSFLTLLLCILAFISTPADARKPSGHGIALVIEDEMISYNDIENRVRMTMVTSGIQVTDQTISDELRSQVIQMIVDEKLYLQEANRLGISISEAELDMAVRNLERKNTLPEGSFYRFISERGLDEDQFVEQLKAQIAWSKIIASQIRPNVLVTEQEVDEEFERLLSASGGDYEVNFSEIIIKQNEGEAIEATQTRASSLFEQIKEGGKAFADIAKEHSSGGTASSGGKIGWIEESYLIDSLKQALSQLRPGTVSAPFRTSEGFTILKLHQKRKKATLKEKQENMAEIILHQLYVPHSKMKTDANEMVSMLASKRNDLSQCSDIEALKEEIPLASATKPVHVIIDELHEEIKPIIRKLDVNKPSDVINSPMGVHIFMVCDKRDSKTVAQGTPDRMPFVSRSCRIK